MINTHKEKSLRDFNKKNFSKIWKLQKKDISLQCQTETTNKQQTNNIYSSHY